MVNKDDLRSDTIYPSLGRIRAISLAIATAVADRAYEQQLAIEPRPEKLEQDIKDMMYDPNY
jgi:malate dehydrogenase (oxaloacetate-decarboxylating)(NADP+)